MKFTGQALSIVKRKEEKPSRGTWASPIQIRKRKGLHYFMDMYQAPTGGLTDDYRRPDRILSDSQIWEVYRRCSDVRASIDSIVRRVATFDWLVEPSISPQDKGYTELAEISQKVKTFLERPNKNGHTWQEIMTAFLTDVLCFDAGAIEIVYSKDGKLAELVPIRGSSVTPITDEYGRILMYQQTMYESGDAFQLPVDDGPQKTTAVEFKPNQMLFFSLFANTANPVGMPLTESLVNEIIALLRASEHAMLALDADEIPQGILILSGIAGKAAEQAKADLQRLRGQDHKIRVMTTPDPAGTGAQWLQLKRNPKEITMRELVESIRRSVYRTFGVMPVEMGMTDGMPRATATVQMDVASSHLVTPILELLQAKINAQILPALIGEEYASRITFRFDRESRADPDDQKKLAEMHQIYVKNGIMTRNEVREILGFLPLEGGDVPTFEVAGMPSPLSSLGKAPKEDEKESEPAGDPVEPFKPSDIADEEEIEAEEIEAFSFYAHRAVGDVDPTNFPKAGDNKKVSLRNSEYDVFDLEFAEMIRLDYPSIWKRGGNILGGKQFRRLKRVINSGINTETDEKAVRVREAWAARHEEDFRLAGVIAQIKWLVVGSRGQKYMKDLVRDEMKKLSSETHSECTDKNCKVPDCSSASYLSIRSRESAAHMSDDDREAALMRALALPSDWQPEGRFKGDVALPLPKLAKQVSSYAKKVLPVYREHREKSLKIIKKVFSKKLSVAQASEDLAKVLLSLTDGWGDVTEDLYSEAGDLGSEWAQEVSGAQAIDFSSQRRAYFEQQMGYLSNGLVKDLRVGMASMLQEARSIHLRDIPAYEVEGEDELEDFYKVDAAAAAALIYLLWAKNEYRIALFSGRLVEVANRDSAAIFATSASVWWVEWNAVGDNRTCAFCNTQGAMGRRPVSELSVMPAGGTPCGGRCRCVLTYHLGR